MNIITIAEYDTESQRMTYDQAKAASKRKGGELLTSEDWLKMPYEEASKYSRYWPFWLEGGLVARGGDSDDRQRDVGALFGPSLRLGVLAKKTGKPEKKNEHWGKLDENEKCLELERLNNENAELEEKIRQIRELVGE